MRQAPSLALSETMRTYLAGCRARADDPPAAALRNHLRRGVLVAQERAARIDREDAVPVIGAGWGHARQPWLALQSGSKRRTLRNRLEHEDSRIRDHLASGSSFGIRARVKE